MLRSPLGRGSRPSDPDSANKVLLYAVLTAVILVLVALGYLVYAVVVRPSVPRTSLERQVLALERIVKVQPANGKAWADYAGALIEAGRFSNADQAISEGLRMSERKAPVLVQRARLEQLRGRDDEALKTAAEAIKEAKGARDRGMAEARKKGLTAPPASSPEIVAAELLRAEIQTKRGRLEEAIGSYTIALEESPMLADVLALRGSAYAKLGKNAAARADFLASLKYDPENKDAHKGLDALGEAKQ